MTTANRIAELTGNDPNNLYWAIEQEFPGMIPESLGVDFSGYPFADGSGILATETEGGDTLFSVMEDFRKELTCARDTLASALA